MSEKYYFWINNAEKMSDQNPDVTIQALKEQVFGSQSNTQPPQASDTPPPSQTAAPEGGAAPATTTTTEPVQPTTQTTATVEDEVLDLNDYLKGYGFDSEDLFKQKIEAWKALETTPPQAQPSFSNEEARKWYEYFTAGKEDDLYQALHSRQQIKGVETMSEEAKLKLYLKMQNPLFDQELIDYQFKTDYGFDEGQFKDEDGNITDPLAMRLAKTKAMQKMQNDLAAAQNYFSQYQSKIDLPALQAAQAAAAATPDTEYERYKQSMAKATEIAQKNTEIFSKLTANDVVSNFKFNDEASKLAFESQFQPDAESMNKALELAMDSNKFWGSFNGPDGNPDHKKFVKFVHDGMNVEKIVAAAQIQAINETKKWFLANQKNIGDGIQRNFTTVVPDELQKLKDQVFGKTG